MKTQILNYLQYFIIRTSIPPLSCLYSLTYSFFIRLATLALKRIPGIASIYLRRGLASGEAVWGLSDIDLLVLVNDGCALNQEKVINTYNRLSRLIPLFGNRAAELGLYQISEFLNLYANHRSYRYRFNEGKHGWKLLYGQDLVNTLQPIENTELCFLSAEELKVWWAYLAAEFQTDMDQPTFKRKYVWYKAIAEASKTCLLISLGAQNLTRKAALGAIREQTPLEFRPMLEELRDLRPWLAGGTPVKADVLFEIFFWLAALSQEQLGQRISGEAIGPLAEAVIPAEGEMLLDGSVVSSVKELIVRQVKGIGPYLEWIALIPQVEFDTDILNNTDIDSFSLVLVLKNAAPLNALQNYVSCFRQNSILKRIEPFMVVRGKVGFSLLPRFPQSCVKGRFSDNLFFSLVNAGCLGSDDNPLTPKTTQVGFRLPPGFENVLRNRVECIDSLIASREIYKVRALDFCHFFWAAARTKLLAVSISNAGVNIPLTSRQISCQLIRKFPEKAGWIDSLYHEYCREFRGEESKIPLFFTECLDLLYLI